MTRLIIVDGYVVADGVEPIDLRDEAWSLALDQRCFGPGRLLVAFGDCDGNMTALAHTRCRPTPELAFTACIRHLGEGAAAAVTLNDEQVTSGPPCSDLAHRYAIYQDIAAAHGIRLVDWIACDPAGELFRSTQLALHPADPWWD